ncbi:hypothetical protein [Labrys neptuniae]
MIRILILGALALVLTGCATPSDFRMQGGMSDADGAAMAKIMGALR